MNHVSFRLRTPALLLAVLACTLAAGCSDGTPQRNVAAATAHAANSPAPVAIARGKVEVQGGMLDVMTQQDGVIEELHVHEGDVVKRGQELLRLDAGPARQDLKLAEAELKLAQARQAGQAARLPAARQLAQRMAEAVRAGATEQHRADEALVAQHDIETAQRVAEAETAVARQRVAVAQARIDRQVLRAAQDGTVVRLQVQLGSQVTQQANRPLMVLLPQRPLQVRAELNESLAGNVKPGMKAIVTIDGAAPQGATTGLAARVLRLGQVVGAGRLGEEAAVRSDLRVVECLLEFEQAPALRVGQEVRVNFYD